MATKRTPTPALAEDPFAPPPAPLYEKAAAWHVFSNRYDATVVVHEPHTADALVMVNNRTWTPSGGFETHTTAMTPGAALKMASALIDAALAAQRRNGAAV